MLNEGESRVIKKQPRKYLKSGGKNDLFVSPKTILKNATNTEKIKCCIVFPYFCPSKKINATVVENMTIYHGNVVILCKDIEEANIVKDIMENHSDIFTKYYNWSGLYLEYAIMERRLIDGWYKLIK